MGKKYLLISIIIIAAILRIVNLHSGDVVGSDEILYAFRAAGMLDFDEAEFQTTPLEWLDPHIPAWTSLSFHDHPPLVFLIQHIFIKIFGENNFAFRFPSALFGIISVYLIYLIGKALFSKNIALISAALLAVTVNHIYISRIGLQESYVIFFMLLASYFFLKALQNDRYFIWAGLALGLGFLSKYNVFILVPALLVYLLVFRRDVFKNKKIWLGALIAFLLFSPVIIYNLKLYQTTGHFDFQFSYIFGQKTEVWKVAPGKEEAGTFLDRLHNFVPNLLATNSLMLIGLFALSLLTLFRRKNAFLLIIFAGLILLILKIGPSNRFLTMFTPFIVLSAANFLNIVYEKMFVNKKRAAMIILALILLWETAYAANSQITDYPKGPQFWVFSRLRYDNYNWGYSELDNYLKQELRGKMPALAFNAQYNFLEKIQNAALEKARRQQLQPYPALIIYDNNIQNVAQAWILDRLLIYHGWPVVKTGDYLKILKENGADYFNRSGLQIYYFIIPTDKVPLKQRALTMTGAEFEQNLIGLGFLPLKIYNKRGEEVFRIYKFTAI